MLLFYHIYTVWILFKKTDNVRSVKPSSLFVFPEIVPNNVLLKENVLANLAKHTVFIAQASVG